MKIISDYANISFAKIVSVIFCFFILSTFIYFSAKANLDLSAGRFALFMDERITFDGVKRILHADGFISFIEAIIHGDQRYGRSLWISMAAFSVVPERIWGDSGQIIAGRTLQVFLIISVWCIFAFGILRNWYLRVVLLIAILVMPYSDYYMSMPKPEPLQLLFLSIFCFFYFRKKLAFGRYWIFAGLAVGTKISTLPALIVFGFSALFVAIRYNPDPPLWRAIKLSLLSFFLGLAIAVPILIIPLLLSVGAYYLYVNIKNKSDLTLMSQGVAIVAGVFVIYLLSRHVIRVWADQTFLNTKHGADQASINAWSWICYYFETWLIVPNFVGIIFIVFSALFVSIFCILCFQTNNVNSLNKLAALSITLSGIALNFSIFFGAQRLWGFYLYPGSVLMVAGLIFMIDIYIHENPGNHYLVTSGLMKLFGCSVAFFIFCIATFFWAPHVMANFVALANRTKSEDYIQQYVSFKEIIKFLDNEARIANKTLQVMLTPSLFPHESNSKYRIVEFWGPYIQWDASPDVIIFGLVNTPRGVPTPSDSPSYGGFLLERQGYAKHVAERGFTCQVTPCFERTLLLPNGGEILVQRK